MAKIATHNPQSFESFSFEALSQCISSIHSALQTSAVNATNRFATIRNWLIGRYIVEYEQRGNDRAQYGARLLASIVTRVRIKGINVTLLQNSRNFYLTYPQLAETVKQIYPMLADKLEIIPLPLNFSVLNSQQIYPTPSDKFSTPPNSLISNLSFSHIVELLTVEDPLIRFFYEFESIRNVWSVKELRRQISTNLHIRVGLSTSTEMVLQKLSEITQHPNSVLQIKDPLALGYDITTAYVPRRYISRSMLQKTCV